MTGHKFQIGQLVTVPSGNLYRIWFVREDDHRDFKGEPGYTATQQRNGQPYGPSRNFPESRLTSAEG